jgi:hypothetical protein
MPLSMKNGKQLIRIAILDKRCELSINNACDLPMFLIQFSRHVLELVMSVTLLRTSRV